MRFLLVACVLSVCCAADAGTIRVRFEAELERYSRSSQAPSVIKEMVRRPISGSYLFDDQSREDSDGKHLGDKAVWNLVDFHLDAAWLAQEIEFYSGELWTFGPSPYEPSSYPQYSYRYSVFPRVASFAVFNGDGLGVVSSDNDFTFFDDFRPLPGIEVTGGPGGSIAGPDTVFALRLVGPGNVAGQVGVAATPPSLNQFDTSHLQVFLGFGDWKYWNLTYNITTLQVIPEPSTASLLLTFSAALIPRRHRHAKRAPK